MARESAYAEKFDEGEPGPNPDLKPALSIIVDRLEKDAEDRVGKRNVIEKRWLDDLRQLHGQYTKDVLNDLTKAKKSKLFINETRPKTTTCESKLSDMLFPTDQENWAIEPTPVPELASQADEAAAAAEDLAAQANKALEADQPGHEALGAAAQASNATAVELRGIMDEAKTRSKAMSAEMSDQLTECQYAIQARDVIHDACGLGTGIIKGPVGNRDRGRRAWTKRPPPEPQENQEEEVQGDLNDTPALTPVADIYDIEWVEDTRPAFYRVDPWSWFPETDARTLEESGSFFERHLLSNKGLRELAKQPGFDKDAIRRLLTHGKPKKSVPAFVSDLRAITGENPAPTDARWQVWEYRGPLEMEEMKTLCECLGRQDMLPEEVDPLETIQVILWFCDGEVLRFNKHYLDSGESIYSVYNLIKDDTSIWGSGIPYIMRDAQAALNGAWRMMMDNAGLSSGPQIEVNQAVVEPADGDWALTARKVWLRLKTAVGNAPGIITYNIESHQAELQQIVEMAKAFMDDVTNISILAQGEQGAHTTQTAGGMTLLMNAVNVIFRGMVKNFDDDLTIPVIRRLYDWNMQLSRKDHIKGDFEVSARGSSVLLVREVQSQNLLVLANMTSHPALGVLLKAVPILRKLAQSMMIEADEIVVTDEELKREADKETAEPPDEDPKLQVEKARAEKDIYLAELEYDIEVMKLGQDRDLKMEDIQAMMDGKKLDHAAKERMLMAEVAAESRKAASGNTTGSGGYI